MNTKRYINININYNNIPPYIIIYIIISLLLYTNSSLLLGLFGLLSLIFNTIILFSINIFLFINNYTFMSWGSVVFSYYSLVFMVSGYYILVFIGSILLIGISLIISVINNVFYVGLLTVFYDINCSSLYIFSHYYILLIYISLHYYYYLYLIELISLIGYFYDINWSNLIFIVYLTTLFSIFLYI